MVSPNKTYTPMTTKSGDSSPKVMPPTASPPRTAISTAPKVMPPTKAVSPSRTAITALKEYCEQEKLSQPQYSEIPQDAERRFQFKVIVIVTSARMTATGDICGSKQQAKQSAARSALQKLRIL